MTFKRDLDFQPRRATHAKIKVKDQLGPSSKNSEKTGGRTDTADRLTYPADAVHNQGQI